MCTTFPYYNNDMVNAQLTLNFFNIEKLFAVIGGSMGECRHYSSLVIFLKKQK
jgi:homoserine acetyltransferase